MLRSAAEQFGDKTVEEVMSSIVNFIPNSKINLFENSTVLLILCEVATQTLEGYQRAIMGTMSVEQIYRDRKAFSSRVFEVASADLAGMGIVVISYTIKEVNDEVGYLKVNFFLYPYLILKLSKNFQYQSLLDLLGLLRFNEMQELVRPEPTCQLLLRKLQPEKNL